VVKAIRGQAEKLLFYSNLVYSEARARAAERLVSIAPEGLTKAFFCNSGTESNENAMRMARMATGRTNIITFSGGFHAALRMQLAPRFWVSIARSESRTCPVTCKLSSAILNQCARSLMKQ